ncbi:hypothetical protein [Ruegeria lacuscaerulensis]|uniref:hypothetical protein n=1 Tax=Ruegeria lacuscaerulensis TaxID=55218 RepID=UPI00147D64A4|nr:hypothetical protein [Ruegeria lacuscaerulensis]
MIKTATEVAIDQVRAGIKSSGPAAHEELSNTTNPNTGRFPPIEHALMDIVNNKRLEGAKKNV